MSDHEDLQLDLAAYAASRLEGPAASRLEEHLRGCADCREMIETFRGFGEALKGDAVIMLAPHPRESSLREYAGLRRGTGSKEVARHLESCAPCSLEVEVWTRTDRSSSARRLRWGSGALVLAAGLAAGFLLAVLLRAGGVPAEPPPTRDALAPMEAAPDAGRLLVLPRALRGGEAPVSYSLEPKQAFIVIACPASVPATAFDGEPFLYEIRREAGENVWSRRMTAADIRRNLTAGVDVIALLVPARTLTTGRYEFLLVRAATPAEPLYRAHLDVTATGESSR